MPGSVDFNDATQVHEWITQTVQRRVWRPRFFAAISTALNGSFDRAIDVVELGSGAGHLAGEVLATCRIASYAAIDVSPANHDTARERLGEAARAVRFLVKDFYTEHWTSDLAPVDAVLRMSGVDDARRRDLRASLIQRIREILRPDGLLLYCDEYERRPSHEPGSAPGRAELPETLRAAGFRRIDELLNLGGMVLLRARA